MHAVYHDYAPDSFQHVWQKNNERPNAPNLRNENKFQLPYPRIERFKKFHFMHFHMNGTKLEF